MVIRDKTDCSFSIAKNAQQYLQSDSSRKAGSKNSSDIDVIENSNRRVIEVITSRHKSSSYVLLNTTCDFFGLLSDRSLEECKLMVLDTYKLIFRFSIGKLSSYLKDNAFLVILL